jgi:hypothetical protein
MREEGGPRLRSAPAAAARPKAAEAFGEGGLTPGGTQSIIIEP